MKICVGIFLLSAQIEASLANSHQQPSSTIQGRSLRALEDDFAQEELANRNYEKVPVIPSSAYIPEHKQIPQPPQFNPKENTPPCPEPKHDNEHHQHSLCRLASA
uniref:AlNc14C538G12094 protein n=1 Tax=Albugo laibachii Nc14 TaxID=890382 RepID=F0X107_9STRA|nr:AlNc14C538G12094 [Albugo laibachii Nc14]|eukprot:CCA27454.1 AlNc14C538G12094 [Albugo laibachii Nc14]